MVVGPDVIFAADFVFFLSQMFVSLQYDILKQ